MSNYFCEPLLILQAVEKQEEKEKKSKRILVPRPEKSLKIKSWFSLENTCKAHVTPEVEILLFYDIALLLLLLYVHYCIII